VNVQKIERRLTKALHSWDQHVVSCRACLSPGRELCVDGEYLAGDVVSARSDYEFAVQTTLPGAPSRFAEATA
jgi:hypothetical protein